jgi:AmmeMemoRadiSam system protein A
MHPLVKLAKETIESYVRTGREPAPPRPLPAEMQGVAGAFVSLHDAAGNLRGCIGTIEPTQPSLALEVIRNAVAAASRDPRFQPVEPRELEGLDVKVDVLLPPEPIDNLDELDPRRYGVIVESGWRRGLLLPDLEGVDTVDMQVAIARQKAGIRPNEECQLYRFEVKRYH